MVNNLFVQSISVTGSKKAARGKFNEDSYIADSEKGIFITADGIGGRNAGKLASQTAVNVLYHELKGYHHMIEDGSLDTVDILDSLKDAVVLTNADRSVVSKGPDLIRSAVQRVGVLKGMLLKDKTLDNKWIPSYVEELLEDLQDFNKIRGTRQLSGMGTTLDGVYLSNDRAYIAHVGDGRVYKISTDGYIRQLTNDHISECTLPPQISSLEKTIRTERNGLISYIGSGSDLLVDIFSIPFRSGETILMLTDGFTKAIAEPELVNAAGNWTHFEKRIMDLYTNPEWMSKVYGRVYDISQTEAQKTLSEKDHATIIAIRRND